MVGDPFELNAEVIKGWLNAFETIALIVLVVWTPIVGLIYVTLIGLAIWGVMAAARRSTGFAPVFITGLYAFVPATYVEYALKRAGVTFCGLGTLVLALAWAIALVVMLRERTAGILRDDRPLHSWRALIGVPLLFVLVLDVLTARPIGAIIIWSVLAVTVLAFVAVTLLTADKHAGMEGADPGQS
jgi:hypothetical protein